MEKLIEKLHQGNYSCVIANGNQIRVFSGRGVSDLYNLLKTEPSFLQGATVADKVVGKGAAALMIQGNVSRVYTDLISQSALELFQKNNIHVEYEQLVPHIENRDKTDWCPLEKSCKDKHSLSEIIPVIDNFISRMRG